MRYQEDEDGKLNNFALEPKMYTEASKTSGEQKNTLLLGIVGGALVLGLIAVTFVISG